MADEPLQTSPSAQQTESRPLPTAWQPFTPRGVSAFASASFGRVLIVQCIVALLATGVAAWLLSAVLFPIVREGIRHLPAQGVIDNGELSWTGPAYQVLQERRPFLAFIVDIENQSRGTPGTDLSVFFRKRQAELRGPFGRIVIPYAPEYQVQFNQREVEPWWGAWQPIILGWVVVGTPVLLLGIWAVLATVYFAPARLLAFYVNRQLSWGGSWRLAAAALMPGALLMIASILLYGLKWIDVWHLLLLAVLHILAGWIFVVLGTLKLPLVPATIAPQGNPFETSADADQPSEANEAKPTGTGKIPE